MIVDDVILERMNDGYQLSASVHSTQDIGNQRLYFLVSDADPGQPAPLGSPFLPALALPAMALGEEVRWCSQNFLACSLLVECCRAVVFAVWRREVDVFT